MNDEVQPEPAHVFDQTNGVIAPQEASPDSGLSRQDRERRRRDSSAQAYGLFATGHQ